MGKIRFSLPEDKIVSDGKGIVKLAYQIRGQRSFFNTKVRLHPVNWNLKKQQAVVVDQRTAKKEAPGIEYEKLITTKKQAEDLNTEIEEYRGKIRKIEKRFEMDGIPYSTVMVMEDLRNKEKAKTFKEQPSKFIYDFVDKYINENKDNRVPGSLTVYKSLKSHLQNFERKRQNGERITFERIDRQFFSEFQKYLIKEGGIRYKKGLCDTTVAKQLSTLKTFLGYAKDQKMIVSNDYKDFKIKKKEGPVIALTPEEFRALLNLQLVKGSPYDHVRDSFCISCYTGLRYSDLKQLSWDHVKENEIVIHIIKKKEPVPHIIPLVPGAKAILEKYKGQLAPLVVISNQRMNDYLKGSEKRKIKSICELAGITEPTETVRFRGAKREAKTVPKFKLISVHTGRKTFVTLSLGLGMSAEEVMDVSGHENYASFKRYVKITEERKRKAMAKAWDSFQVKPPKTKLRVV